tara:strand:+ start:2355 stop:3557 length:1203 start_codon:yes stop_codon:yes gene_type:complete
VTNDCAPAVITILGSTGSIGESTLDIIRQHPQYKVFALSAHSNVEKILDQCRQFQPEIVAMVDEAAADDLQKQLQAQKIDIQVRAGAAALVEISIHEKVDTVMAAIVGSAGLESTLAAVQACKKVLLANKESLVMAGELFMQAVADSDACLLPIDSEHNAIYQCLPECGAGKAQVDSRLVKRIILTASGGPFLNTPLEDFAAITPAQACAHPNWKMGKKISVDSATMMNKGLEFIEACYLFGLEANQLEVLIHPQSIVHSLVEYNDGSVLAQMATPDMRIPIAYGLAWPQRIPSGASFLDLSEESALEFQKPDLARFPCLQLGMDTAAMRGTAPTLLNAANEVAVDAFLCGKINFSQIVLINAEVLSKIPCETAATLAIIQEADLVARSVANELINKLNY